MIDEYGYSGRARWSVGIRCGHEKMTIVVCADTLSEAESVAMEVAENEEFIIWEDCDSVIEIDAEPEMTDEDECEVRDDK